MVPESEPVDLTNANSEHGEESGYQNEQRIHSHGLFFVLLHEATVKGKHIVGDLGCDTLNCLQKVLPMDAVLVFRNRRGLC